MRTPCQKGQRSSGLHFTDYKFGGQLLGVDNCPHCNVSKPLLRRVFSLVENQIAPRGDGGPPSGWSVYRCTSCGYLVTAKGKDSDTSAAPFVEEIFPPLWSVNEAVPERVAHYLVQAQRTLNSPDASVIMSASSIDAMLKDHGLPEGDLHKRIDLAVKNAILTRHIADWGKRVRLDTVNRRYAAVEAAPMEYADAKRAFDFANAMTEYLYVLPARIPADIRPDTVRANKVA